MVVGDSLFDEINFLSLFKINSSSFVISIERYYSIYYFVSTLLGDSIQSFLTECWLDID